jgi:hypothetical protein
VRIAYIVEMALEVDEATCFIFVHLIEQGSVLYDKSEQDYAQRDDLIWHENEFYTR